MDQLPPWMDDELNLISYGKFTFSIEMLIGLLFLSES